MWRHPLNRHQRIQIPLRSWSVTVSLITSGHGKASGIARYIESAGELGTNLQTFCEVKNYSTKRGHWMNLDTSQKSANIIDKTFTSGERDEFLSAEPTHSVLRTFKLYIWLQFLSNLITASKTHQLYDKNPLTEKIRHPNKSSFVIRLIYQHEVYYFSAMHFKVPGIYFTSISRDWYQYHASRNSNSNVIINRNTSINFVVLLCLCRARISCLFPFSTLSVVSSASSYNRSVKAA